MAEKNTAYGRRIKAYGQWQDEINLDRFITLVFMSAQEKEAFSKKHFGASNVCYLDGADVVIVQIKPEALADTQTGEYGEKRRTPEVVVEKPKKAKAKKPTEVKTKKSN
jgi:hypothetical protein